MSVIIGGKNISAVSVGRTVVSQINKGLVMVWTGIRSCFGSGFWVNEKGWQNSESWKN